MSAQPPERACAGGWRAKFLNQLAEFITGWPRSIVAATLVLAALSAIYAGRHLTLDANTDSLISPDRAFMRTYREFMREFGDLEYLYVAVDARGNPESAKAAVDALEVELASISGVPAVHARIDADEQWRLAPRAMSNEELQAVLGASDGFAALVDRAAKSEGADALLREAGERLARLQSNGISMDSQERQRLAAGALFLMKAVTAQRGDGFDFAQPRSAEYLVSSSGNIFFVELLPRKDFAGLATIEPILAEIRRVISAVQSRFPAVDIGLTGKPVLQADELATTNADMTRGTVVAAILVALLTMWTLGSVVRPLLVMGMLAVTFAVTYGAAALLVGRLNLLSLVFMLVLVSAGVDYGIHTVARYTEFRLRLGATAAMRAAIVANTIPTWVGALTSAAVFFLALGTEFGGLRELGIIAGTGLLVCAVILTVALPALVVLVDQWRERRALVRLGSKAMTAEHPNLGGHFFPGEPVESATYSTGATGRRRDRRALVAGAAITLGLCGAIPFLKFETNLLRLQADGLDSIAWEHRILDDSVSASWFGAVLCRSQEEVARVIDRASREPLIAEARSVFDLVKAESSAREKLREELARVIPRRTREQAEAPSATPATALTAATVAGVHDQLRALIALASLTSAGDALAELRSTAQALGSLKDQLEDPAQRLAAQSRAELATATTARALDQLGIGARSGLRESLPVAVRDRLVSPEGGLLVSLFPRNDIWEFVPLQQFVAALRTIDADATGVPMTVYESVVDMRSAFVAMSTWSLVVIAFLVWLDLRSTVATLTCLACLLLGMSWTLGMLTLLGVSLNLANFFSVPMLLGFGIDSCVHVMHRAREGGSARDFGWTTRAVILSAVTTAVGFGTLLFAAHKGLQSLGWVMCIGSAACLICAVGVLPAALRRFPRLLGLPSTLEAVTTSAQEPL
ncbi:MAG: hypothetical protein EXS17_04215 [Phycisphaerales bacterium]|nr:hypothetical protein [Phycisphaerales bacterium]